jgi:hypothetical protein
MTLREHGFYEVRRPGQAAGSGRVVAANLDLSETDLTPVDLEAFSGTIRPPDGPVAGAAGNIQPGTAEERERRQAIWWYLLIGAFLALVAEALLANRLSRAATT